MTRCGKRNRAFFRIGVFDSRTKAKGKCIEYLGSYNPMKETENIEIKEARVQHWLDKGVLPTEKVAALLRKKGMSVKATT